MSRARYFAALSRAPAPTGPTLWFSGDTLATGDLFSWQNQGLAGSAQSLTPGTGTAPTCLPGGPNGFRFARFVGQDWLRTPHALGISGSMPFTIAFVFRVKNLSARNMLGFGQQTDAQMFDVYYDREQVTVHQYGPTGAMNDARAAPDQWHVAVGAYNGLNLTYLNGTLSITQNVTPAVNSLNLGAGQWPPLNSYGDNVIDIADFRLFERALSEEELTELRLSLTQRYNLPA